MKSTGGYTGETFTPENTGHTMKVVFSLGNIYSHYMNDSLTCACKFTVKKVKFNFNGVDREIDVIYYENRPISQTMSLRNDTLMLVDYNLVDGFTNTYVRIR